MIVAFCLGTMNTQLECSLSSLLFFYYCTSVPFSTDPKAYQSPFNYEYISKVIDNTVYVYIYVSGQMPKDKRLHI